MAISPDGINWEKYGDNPILTPTEEWEYHGTYYSSVIFDGNNFMMVYSNYLDNDMAFGAATSQDGIHWTKNINNPLFNGISISNNWTSRPLYPCLIKAGENYRVYYSSTYSSFNDQAIGFLNINKF